MFAKDGPQFDFRQWRRFQAVKLRRQGWRRWNVAQALGVTETSVSHWVAQARMFGASALLSHPIPGRPPELSPAQQHLIPELLWHGAQAYGFRGSLWTCLRIARVIQEEFAVAYDKSQVSRLLKRLKWTPQTPIQRALQRDEAAIGAWPRQTWPRLLGEAKIERRTLVFVDESGFYLLSSVVKTYAPIAQTPVLRARLTRDHLSVIGGMTPAGRIYTLARQESLNGLHVIEFLTHLTRVADKRLLVIWDGSPIHRRMLVKDFVSGTHGGIRVETLPAYAPDLNPWDTGGWNHLKNVEMRNLACRDVEQLHQEFHLAIARLRQKTRLIHGFYAQAGLTLETM